MTTLDPAYPNPETLAAEVEPWLRECGSCDAALPMACTCPPGDYRVVLLKVWRAYEGAERAIRRQVAEEIAAAIQKHRDTFSPESPIETELYVAEEIAREIGARP